MSELVVVVPPLLTIGANSELLREEEGEIGDDSIWIDVSLSSSSDIVVVIMAGGDCCCVLILGKVVVVVVLVGGVIFV